MAAPTPRPRISPARARQIFARFNRKYFDGELATPEIRIVPAGQAGTIVNACGDWGACLERPGQPALIELRAVSAEVHPSYLNANILHELLHLSIGTEYDHRSREWRREVRRVSDLGALIEVI